MADPLSDAGRMYVREPGHHHLHVREATDAEVLAHPAAAAVVADRDRLRDVLAAERGERGPEGWKHFFDNGTWEHGLHHGRVWRSWMRGRDGSDRYEYGWEVYTGPNDDRHEGRTTTALEAMEAADRAAGRDK